ncbi:MAG: VWA domain-containing protein [Gammaproteobacteria bacterium]|nr:VWA domain-containing protein [Gammaproteobacteria bacterium]
MSRNDDKTLPQTNREKIDHFLQQVAQTPRIKASGKQGRLIFAMDATASREPTWDQACHIQSQMFEETDRLGGLEIQLCYYRGFKEFNGGPWLDNGSALRRCMETVRCLGGMTQIQRLFDHTIAEARRSKVNALVFVCDAMEEDIEQLSASAGQLGLLGIPIFLFHEGKNPEAARAFDHFARLSGGACCPFDARSASQLRDLLSAVAVYAAGGQKALEGFSSSKGNEVRRLTDQLRKD